MSRSIIVEGKTTAEAIEKGLKELNVSKNMVEIKNIEDEKKRSFYSILAPRVVKIEMTLKDNKSSKDIIEKETRHINREKIIVNKNLDEIENVSKKIEEVFNTMFEKEVKCEVEIRDFNIYVNINGENINHFIGYRGATVNALQTIATAISNKNSTSKIMVFVDVGNYKEKREKTLEELAEKVSKTVMRTKKTITLEPMTAYERKVIHTKLQDNEKVKTYSKGEEPYRRVVIALR